MYTPAFVFHFLSKHWAQIDSELSANSFPPPSAVQPTCGVIRLIWNCTLPLWTGKEPLTTLHFQISPQNIWVTRELRLLLNPWMQWCRRPGHWACWCGMWLSVVDAGRQCRVGEENSRACGLDHCGWNWRTSGIQLALSLSFLVQFSFYLSVSLVSFSSLCFITWSISLTRSQTANVIPLICPLLQKPGQEDCFFVSVVLIFVCVCVCRLH